MDENHNSELGKLLTKKEIAEILGISVRSVENFTNHGVIPKITIGSKIVRYPSAIVFKQLKKSIPQFFLDDCN